MARLLARTQRRDRGGKENNCLVPNHRCDLVDKGLHKGTRDTRSEMETVSLLTEGKEMAQ